jgi:hypothetical protein
LKIEGCAPDEFEDESGNKVLNFGEEVSLSKCYLDEVETFYFDTAQLYSDSLIIVEISTYNGSIYFDIHLFSILNAFDVLLIF